MKQYTTIFLLFFCAQLSLAQTSDTLASFTLKDCMTFAIAHSTKLEIQAADNRDAQISRRDAILRAFTPSISGGTYAALNFGRGVDPETNTYVSTTSFTNGYSVSGSITLFNGFSAVNNIKIAKTAVLMGITREQQLKDELCLAVMQAYCNALYFQQMLHSLNQQVVSAQTNLTLAQQQEQLGQKSRADVIDLEADLADREYQLVSMTNQYNDALLTLKDLMLYPLDQPFAIDTTFNYSALLSNAELLNTNADAALHPSLRLAQWRMENARTELKTARWHLAPSLSLSGGWSTGYYTYPSVQDYMAPSFASQFNNNSGEYVQLSLSIPIYDGLSRQSNIVRKKNAYRRATAEYEQTKHEVQSEITRATQDRQGALSALRQATKRTQAQHSAYIMSNKKFQQGHLSPTDLRLSSDKYLQAQAEQLNAQLQFFIKNCVVYYYQGISYIDQL